MWLIVISGLVVSGESLADRMQARESTAAPAGVYASMLSDSRCSGVGAAGARGRDLVLVREAARPVEQWWWNAFPHADFERAIPNWLPGMRAETLQGLLDRSARATQLDSAIALASNVAWTNRVELEALAQDGAFWQSFYKRFPSATGLIELSPVGFAPDGREALAYCGRTSESLSGSGYLVLLRHDDGRWQTVVWKQVWQS